jgi:hypothetical protein
VAKKFAAPALICILILAVALRIWGIGWGLPTSRHYFSYHPDETMVLSAALKVNLLSGDLNPGFYNYGSLFVYLVNIATVAATASGAINLPPDDIFSRIGEFAKMYMAGRVVAVLLGILTVYLLYALGRRAYGRAAGLLAALFMAVIPIHVMHSRFVAVDVPATFFIVLALIFAIRITDGHRLRDYIFAGLFAGLAAGTKYNAGLVLLSPIIAHFASDKAKPLLRIVSPKLLGIIIAAAAGFLIGTPGALLYRDAFARDFLFEVHHTQTGHGLLFTNTGSGFVYHITHSLWPGMGLPLLVLAGIGLLYAIKKRSSADLAMLVFLVAYYAVIGMAQVRFARYTIPILPVLVLLAARVSADLMRRLFSGRAAARSFGVITALVVILVTGYTLAYSLSVDRISAAPDTRDQAGEWIEQNIPLHSSIGLPTIPWFYTPPIDPYFGLVNPSERYDRVRDFTDYDLVVSQSTEWDAGFLRREAPTYVVLSEFEYEDRLRVGDQSAGEYFRVLARDYHLVRRFTDSPSLLGLRIPLVPELPHDMSYASPTILIYERKAG